MIIDLSKVATALAPVFAFVGILLSLLAFIAPDPVLRISLLTITPSTSSAGVPSHSGNSSDILLGLLSSCIRSPGSTKLHCTSRALKPVYNLSPLPAGAPSFLVSPPTILIPAFLVALVLSMVFLLSFTLATFGWPKYSTKSDSEKKPDATKKIKESNSHRWMRHIVIWSGLCGLLIGLSFFLLAKLWFDKIAIDFNKGITTKSGPIYTAQAGNGFTLAWLSYGAYLVPMFMVLKGPGNTVRK